LKQINNGIFVTQDLVLGLTFNHGQSNEVKDIIFVVGSESKVLTAASMKIGVFWDVAL
jgi:hypothetical protein